MGVEKSAKEMPPPPLPRRVVDRKAVGGGDGEIMPPPPPVRKAEPMSSKDKAGGPVTPTLPLPMPAMEDGDKDDSGVQIMLPPPSIMQSHTGTPRPTMHAWPKRKPDNGALRAELLSLGETEIKPVVPEGTPSTGEEADLKMKKIPTSTSRRSYEEPQWSGLPSAEYAFEVIKSGVVASKEIISRSDRGYVLLGRDPEQVDIVLAHPSLSRVHAAIQFRKDDPIAYLIDLNSTHGTFLNKKRVQSGKYIAMSVGDVVKFGDSSRIYVLLGPSEASDRTVKIKDPTQEVQKDPVQLERELAVSEQRKKLQEVTWGMDEDAVEEEEETEGAKEELVPENLSKKQRQVLDRIEAKKGKILSMQQELSNIRNKEVSSELTDGQVNRISQLEERMRQLEESIEDSYSNLRENSVSSKSKKRERRKSMEGELDSDNDDFFDRTTEVSSARTTTGSREGQAETENTLKSKQKQYLEEQKMLEKEYSKASLRLGGEIAGGEADALDSFMSSNDRSILEENLRDLVRRMDKNREKLSKVGDLLSLAQGASLESIPLPSNRKATPPKTLPGTDKLDTVEKAFQVSPPEVTRAPALVSTYGTEAQPEKPQADMRLEPGEIQSERCFLWPPVLTGSPLHSRTSLCLTELDEPDEFKHPSEHKRARRVGPLLPKRTAEHEAQEKGLYDWKPPEDQRGDGRSKLNDKFGY
uniref:FHA domain-containing protein n=1 Tax=Rhodosorus marinus TaxID=101924 RepID=A0A7S2ZG65_9RHOD